MLTTGLFRWLIFLSIFLLSGRAICRLPPTQDHAMAFVHGTTTTLNDAPAEDLILDAAKETPTTLKLGHNAEKYAKVSVFSYSCCWNILLGLRLIFSRLYKTYKNLRHTLIFRSLYLKQVLTQYKNWVLLCQSKWKCSFYLSVYIFIIYLQRFLQVLFNFFFILPFIL